MSAHKPSVRWSLLAAAGLVLVAALTTLITNRENTSSVVATPESPPLVSVPATPESPPLPTIPTLLPPPNPEMRDFFPEYAQLERFTYDPDSYPQYAEVLPDAPCATWENGGLTWSYFEDESNRKLGWGASVWIPIYRFCGFPLPYPQKPAQTRIEDAPREWVDWKMTQLAGTPSATPESLPLAVIPTLLPSPYPIDLEIFPEYVMERYAYDEAAYPQYAEALPEAPCATWENGGLTWSYRDDLATAKLGWVATVWLPIYRFCGFPLPYPQKPAQTEIVDAPREWVDWKMTQMAGTPTPEPTSPP